jgi:hypothetical protein
MASIDLRQLATAALSFTVAMSWNDAMSKIANYIYPSSELMNGLIRALLITITIIMIMLIVNYFITQPSGEEFEPVDEK